MTPKQFSLEEVSKHKTRKDAWIVIHNKVYDVSSYLSKHPGGRSILLENCGKDATKEYEDHGHTSDSHQVLDRFVIGELRNEDRKPFYKPAQIKQYSIEEVKKHNTKDDCWICIHNKVYDVTKFLIEHPGGDNVLLEHAGGYATSAFEDVGHSEDSREMMNKYMIGHLIECDREATDARSVFASSTVGSWSGMLIPLTVVIIAISIFKLHSMGYL